MIPGSEMLAQLLSWRWTSSFLTALTQLRRFADVVLMDLAKVQPRLVGSLDIASPCTVNPLKNHGDRGKKGEPEKLASFLSRR